MMKRLLTLLLITAAVAAFTDTATAQRRINPVKQPDPTTLQRKAKKPWGPDRSNLAERLDAQGNVVLVDTVTGLEFVDTTAALPDTLWATSIHYCIPVTVGLDVWDPVMRIIGQDYGGASVWGTIGLHNRFSRGSSSECRRPTSPPTA